MVNEKISFRINDHRFLMRKDNPKAVEIIYMYILNNKENLILCRNTIKFLLERGLLDIIYSDVFGLFAELTIVDSGETFYFEGPLVTGL